MSSDQRRSGGPSAASSRMASVTSSSMGSIVGSRGEVRLDPEGRIQSERFTSRRLPVMDPMLDDVTLAIRLDAALGPPLRR